MLFTLFESKSTGLRLYKREHRGDIVYYISNPRFGEDFLPIEFWQFESLMGQLDFQFVFFEEEI